MGLRKLIDEASVQPKLDRLADFLRPAWSPRTHAGMPPALRERARLLLLVGEAFCKLHGMGFRDLWVSLIMPRALAGFHVQRGIS